MADSIDPVRRQTRERKEIMSPVVRKTVPWAIAALLICAVIAGFSYAKKTPRYSLYMLKKAIIERDTATALKYLDTDMIIDNFAKTHLSNTGQEGGGLRGKVVKNVIMQNLPSIKRQLKEQPHVYMSIFITDETVSKLKKLTILAFKISTEGKSASVDIRGSDKINLKMEQTPRGHWKVTAINLKELPFLKE